MSPLWLALCCFFPCRELIFTAYLIRHDFQPDMVFTVLHKHERRVSQDSFESWLFMPCPVTAPKIGKGFLFIYNAVMILTTPFRSISSSGSVSCLSLHHCQHLYFCLSPLFRPFLSPACIVSSPLISVAFQLDAQMNMLHCQNTTWHLLCAIASPRQCFYHILCHWFYFDKKPKEETALFSPSLSSPKPALFVFNYCPW